MSRASRYRRFVKACQIGDSEQALFNVVILRASDVAHYPPETLRICAAIVRGWKSEVRANSFDAVCLACSTRLQGRPPPPAFAVVTPDRHAVTDKIRDGVIVTGICAKCATKTDAALIEALKRSGALGDNVRELGPAGHA